MKNVFALRWAPICALLTALVLNSAAVATTAAKSHILILGDSLSAGYGLSSGEGWVDLLAKKLDREKISATLTNASISGETTAGGVSRLPALLAKHKPTHVVIELGGNDGLRGAPIATAKANLQRMADTAKAAGAKVVIVGMRMPPNFGPSYTAQFEAIFVDVAKAANAALVPFFLAPLGTDLKYFQADRIHPTTAAQPLLLGTVWPVLQKTLK